MSVAWLCLMSGVCSTLAVSEPPEEYVCLKEAYTEHVCGWGAGQVILCDGGLVPWDNGYISEDYIDYLDHADLSDQMKIKYPLGREYEHPELNEDPGRARSEVFFRRIYGQDARAVRKTLKDVTWMVEHGGRTIRVTGVNGVDTKLKAVERELMQLDRAVWKKVIKDSGTFVWRAIKGTNGRLSMHSFAIAVDVGVPISDYWRWNKPDAEGRYAYKNKMPLEVVEVFERHGFIWGGKWYHFDTMHFEYRPELILCGER